MKRLLLFTLSFSIVSGCSLGASDIKSSGGQRAKEFSSPHQASEALVQAVQSGQRSSLLEIFGADAAGLLDSGDAVADQNALEKFSSELGKKRFVEAQPDGKYVLLVGERDWPFPIPIVSDGKQWWFDTAAGREEILNRRIGENELKTIRVARAFVDAQKEYFKKDRDGDGVQEYAQKAVSSPGKKDGLYWEPTDERDESPFGPLVADAVQEGYRPTGEEPIPFHGYYFKILTSQGRNAAGGERSYLNKTGSMTKGFALMAYPARWGVSGIMTFVVNRQGIVFQRDFGVETLAAAQAAKAFNPDAGWDPVIDRGEDAVEEE